MPAAHELSVNTSRRLPPLPSPSEDANPRSLPLPRVRKPEWLPLALKVLLPLALWLMLWVLLAPPSRRNGSVGSRGKSSSPDD